MTPSTRIYFVIAIVAVVIIAASSYLAFLRLYAPIQPNPSSNGAMIYTTGADSSGARTQFTGGPTWFYMHGGGCANCHGYDGVGGSYPMMCSVVALDIRYSTLTDPSGTNMTPDQVARAITQGLDEEGKTLDGCMPRWQMNAQDLNDLISYLKELG